MTKFNSIEEMNVWQEGVDLAIVVYGIIRKDKDFLKDFGLRDQIRKSVISISSNIAEGFERETNPEFIRFLYIAKGSCGELRTQVYIAFRLSYVSEDDFQKIYQKCKYISSMLMKLIKTLKP